MPILVALPMAPTEFNDDWLHKIANRLRALDAMTTESPRWKRLIMVAPHDQLPMIPLLGHNVARRKWNKDSCDFRHALEAMYIQYGIADEISDDDDDDDDVMPWD